MDLTIKVTYAKDCLKATVGKSICSQYIWETGRKESDRAKAATMIVYIKDITTDSS